VNSTLKIKGSFSVNFNLLSPSDAVGKQKIFILYDHFDSVLSQNKKYHLWKPEIE